MPGATGQLPLVEHHLSGEDYLTAPLAVRPGGRAAGFAVPRRGSLGAASGLASAAELATTMAREPGLSGKLGLAGNPQGGSVFLGGGGGLSSHPSAEATHTGHPRRGFSATARSQPGRSEPDPPPRGRRGLTQPR